MMGNKIPLSEKECSLKDKEIENFLSLFSGADRSEVFGADDLPEPCQHPSEAAKTAYQRVLQKISAKKVVFRVVKDEEVTWSTECLLSAAGVADEPPIKQKLASKLFEGEDVYLSFARSTTDTDIFLIGVRGIGRDLLVNMDLLITFQNGEKEILYGRDLKKGGPWACKTKGREIKSVDIKIRS